MFNQIKESNKPFPYQTFTLVGCSIGVTIVSIFFPNLLHVFGSSRPDISLLQALSLPFQHGYDATSAVVHMSLSVLFLLFMGGTLEKIIAPNRFFVLNFSIIITYAVFHKLFGMIGHGLTPVLFAYVPFVAYSVNEGRLIKTRSMYDEYYKTLWALILIVVILIPILLSMIPIYFDSNATFAEQVMKGNILHIILLILGTVFMYLWKENARRRLLYFAKKKKFPLHRYERYTPYLALAYPLLLIFIFLLNK